MFYLFCSEFKKIVPVSHFCLKNQSCLLSQKIFGSLEKTFLFFVHCSLFVKILTFGKIVRACENCLGFGKYFRVLFFNRNYKPSSVSQKKLEYKKTAAFENSSQFSKNVLKMVSKSGRCQPVRPTHCMTQNVSYRREFPICR